MPAHQILHSLQNKLPVRRIVAAGPGDAQGNGPHILRREAPAGDAGRTDAHAAGDHGLFRVVGNGVLVYGNVQPVQPLLQGPAGDAPAAQIHQHQVAIKLLPKFLERFDLL